MLSRTRFRKNWESVTQTIKCLLHVIFFSFLHPLTGSQQAKQQSSIFYSLFSTWEFFTCSMHFFGENVVRERKWCVWMRSLIGAWTLVALRAFFFLIFLEFLIKWNCIQKILSAGWAVSSLLNYINHVLHARIFMDFLQHEKHFFTPACAFSYCFNQILN